MMTLTVQFTEEEARAFQAHALAAGMTASDFLKARMLEEAGLPPAVQQQPERKKHLSGMTWVVATISEWATDRIFRFFKKED